MAPVVFPDNTVFCNFAAVERIDLLVAWLRGRGRWCEAVHHETTRSARCLSALTQLTGNDSPLGNPIIIDDPSEMQKINRIREVVFGGSIDKPTQHLGEAQTCWVIDGIASHGRYRPLRPKKPNPNQFCYPQA